MKEFDGLYEFTGKGMELFLHIFQGRLSASSMDLTDRNVARRIPKTKAISISEFASAKEMAAFVLDALSDISVFDVLPCSGLWGWLTFVLRDQLFKCDRKGNRKVGEVHRWYPSDANDWRKGQRHMVRMPVLLLDSLGDIADHLLCRKLSILPEIREQLTSQKDMLVESFQCVARTLYFDEKRGDLKRGAGGKGGGSPRRLAKVRRQLDVTWDLEELSEETIMEKLPREFDRFKPKRFVR